MEPHPILSTISAIIKFFCRLNRKEDLKSSFTGSLTFTLNTTVNLSPFFVDVIIAVPTMTKRHLDTYKNVTKFHRLLRSSTVQYTGRGENFSQKIFVPRRGELGRSSRGIPTENGVTGEGRKAERA